MGDYDIPVGGRLSLKGSKEGDVAKSKKKKKKRKHESNVDEGLNKRKKEEKVTADDEDGEGNPAPVDAARGEPAEESTTTDRKTAAERRFEETQRRRMEEKVMKLADKTHKDRVNEFNAKLESLSEHHDIPKVGPG